MLKCVPILDKMPTEIMEKIVGYTDNMDKLRLRQCCKYFKKIVDDLEIVLEQLLFHWNYYERSATVYVPFTDHHNIDKTFDDTNHEEPTENAMAALKFVEKVLKSHPKIRLVELQFNVEFKTGRHSVNRELVIEEVSRVFSGLENKLPVETLTIQSFLNEQLLMSVLPHLVPGTLRKLYLVNTVSRGRIDFSRTVKTEQWKQAKMLYAHNCLSICLEDTDHFEYMEYKVKELNVEDVKRIVENILRENGWKQRSICTDEYDFEAIKQYLLRFDHKLEGSNEEDDDADTLTMTISRDGYECMVHLDRRVPRLIFERIDNESVP